MLNEFGDEMINMNNITVDDCIKLFEYKNTRVIINNGEVTEFEEE